MWLIPLAIAFLGGLLGVADKLLGDDRKAFWIGVASVVVLIFGLSWQGRLTFSAIRETQRLKVFTESGLDDIDEASGGVSLPETGLAYVVDDDEPSIFKFEFNADENRYVRTGIIQLLDASGVKLGDSELEDLEAISVFAGKVYAITSHSNRRNGGEEDRRRKLLEICIEDGDRGRILRTANLRSAITKRLTETVTGRPGPIRSVFLDEEDKNEVMNIEGLAISPNGRAYIGFRSPLIDGKHALVMSADLGELFEPNPRFEVYLLELLFNGNHYSITEMAFDVNGKDILIIGNSRKRLEFFRPVLWRWPPKQGEGIQIAQRLRDGFMVPPEHFRAKPEAMVISTTAGHIGIFADADGYGGHRVYDRKELGLE